MTDGSIRFLAGLSLAALAAITGIVSYLHTLTVVHLTGSAGVVAYLIPFVADLMIVTASLAILDAIRHRARKPPLAMVSLVTGIGSTLGMNIVADCTSAQAEPWSPHCLQGHSCSPWKP